jgi:hypothetical protein
MDKHDKLPSPQPNVNELRARLEALEAQAGQMVIFATSLAELTDPGQETRDLIHDLVYDANDEPYNPEFAKRVEGILHKDD